MSRHFLAVALILVACQTDQEKARAALEQATVLEGTEPEAAIAKLREAVALDPTLREADAELATLELAQGDLAAAAGAATSALELRCGDASMLLVVAKAAIADERWAVAEEALIGARAADGSLTAVLPLLALAQAALKKASSV